MQRISNLILTLMLGFIALFGCDDPASPEDDGETGILNTITSDTTLVNIFDDPSQPDYLIESDISVNAVLTVEPGVVVHVNEGEIIEIGSSGAIIAKGTASDSIIFTSSNEAGDIHWGGLSINSSDSRNELSNVRVSYAGGAELNYMTWQGDIFANIAILEDAQLSINNSTISYSNSFGLHVETGGSINTFSSNNFNNNHDVALKMPVNQFGKMDTNTLLANNGKNAAQAYGSSISNGDNQEWEKLADGATYHITGDVGIHSELAIAAGAMIELSEGVMFQVDTDGVLIVNGTETDSVIFTSDDIAGGRHWTGINILSNDARNLLNYTKLSYAGSLEERQYYRSFLNDIHASVGVIENARVSIRNSTISHSASKGLAVDYGGSLVDFESNLFDNNTDYPVFIIVNEVYNIDESSVFTNNSDNVVRVYDDYVVDDQEWVKLHGTAAYSFRHSFNIQSALTINPGAILKFDEDLEVTVTSSGSITAEGIPTNEIIFTSSNELGQIRWAGIDVNSSSTLNSLEYVTVNWAGGNQRLFYSTFVDADGDVHANIGLQDDARLKLTNSRILNAGEYGVALLSGAEINGSRDATIIINANTEFNNPDATADVLVE
ncbi:MAG: hypothetical protein GF372_10620 [Candidatus Marinimicrobia bacterium]|nr:hypothetical protein [Candidatus Neomarinimicrobiota bacterium]